MTKGVVEHHEEPLFTAAFGQRRAGAMQGCCVIVSRHGRRADIVRGFKAVEPATEIQEHAVVFSG